MYISGKQVQKSAKKQRKTEQKSKIEEKIGIIEVKKSLGNERPYSSELKLMQIRKNYSIGLKDQLNSGKNKNRSKNKIIIKKSQQIDSNQTVQHKKQSHKYSNSNKKQVISHKKIVQKSVPIKAPVATTPQKVIIQLSPIQIIKISGFFRYHPISIITIAGCRQEFMRELTTNQDFSPLKPYKKPSKKVDISSILYKLMKNCQLKGKYRLRERFNYLTSPQLKAINYKKKQPKKRKDSSTSSSDDQIKQKCRDMTTWKKVMGVQGKVFIIKGKYPYLRKALLGRGWTQNQDKKSTFYDLRWTTKISDINFNILKPNQMVNHFNNNACLTSKYGIIKSLRSVMFNESIDIDKFFPKAFDMSDLSDFQNFLEIYKWIYCETLLKKFVQNIQIPYITLQKIKVALIVCQRRLSGIKIIISEGLQNNYGLCSPNQWKFLQTHKKDNEISPSKKQKNVSIQDTVDKILTSDLEDLKRIATNTLNELKYGNDAGNYEPQFDINGNDNIWIVKPSFLSRGRGIKCLTGLSQILDSSLGKETQYVVQKYIENPLIINHRKFDIRIWVLVQDYCPPKIWFYNPFYVRFCLQPYTSSALKNKYAHLTNNSIQKYNKKVSATQLAQQSMWDRQKFQTYIQAHYSKLAFKRIISQMKQIIIATILGTVDQVSGRNGSFQLIGYDMMIDECLNTWLIQINSSPAMDSSTEITKKLVANVMEDLVKVVVDLRSKNKVISKGQTAGDFKCIYSGGQFKVKNFPMGARTDLIQKKQQIKEHRIQKQQEIPIQDEHKTQLYDQY